MNEWTCSITGYLPAGRQGAPKMCYYVYILRSKSKGLLYKGISRDPNKRLKEHNSGKNRSTKGHRPWEIVYQEKYESRIAARIREKYFKSGHGREYLMKKLDL